MAMSGVLPMKAQCIPFPQIPHSSRLFLDYLSYVPAVKSFYPRSPVFSEWVKDEARAVVYDDARRAKVAEILERQNRAWGASARALKNIERFRDGALTAVTGQQVSLFGGPLFSILKALTAAKLAEQTTAAGVDCVPVFWLATEDHDLAEVSHISLLSGGGAPESLRTDSAGVADAPVGTVKFGPEIEPVVARAVALLGDSEVSQWLREAYRPGETLGSAFGRLFARVLADAGVILLDPADREFHQVAKPMYRSAIERAGELTEALLARGKALEAAGYHQQVKVTPATTLLFEVRTGARTVVHRKVNGEPGWFTVGEEKVSQAELLERVERAPENFNPNALFRPAIQDYLLPTLVYTGGSAEVAYFAQAGVVYEKLLKRVTPILPRFSATLVETGVGRLLDRYQLGFGDVLEGPDAVRQKVASKCLPAGLQAKFSGAYAGAEETMTALRESIEELDPTLVRSADRARMRMWYQINRLQRQAARAELLRNDVIARHAASVSHALFPNKVLQEREISGISFLARYGRELLSDLYEHIQPDCHDHQVIEL